MTDSAQSRDDAARTKDAADEVATEVKRPEISATDAEAAAAASPEQLHLARQSAIRPRAQGIKLPKPRRELRSALSRKERRRKKPILFPMA